MKISIAYYVSSKDETLPKIDFFVNDPNKQLLYMNRKDSEAIFSFNTTIPGTYSFKFSNTKVSFSDNHLFYSLEIQRQLVSLLLGISIIKLNLKLLLKINKRNKSQLHKNLLWMKMMKLLMPINFLSYSRP